MSTQRNWWRNIFFLRGLSNFLFYSESDNWSYEARGKGFQNALARKDHECTWLRWHQSAAFRTDNEQWKQRRKWLSAHIKQAPKPVGVFAANDEHALHVLEACEAANIHVPEQVAIVGAENYLLAPDAMGTRFRAWIQTWKHSVIAGAALLDDLMDGKKSPARTPPSAGAGMIVRKSSDLLAVNHKGVANSLRFIWEHCHEMIGVEDLVGVAAMSRRGLHKAFMEHLGRTPGQELQRVRIERAKRLLRESGYKLEVLCHMCGYQSANSFCIAFKQATGMSPKQYRDQAQTLVESQPMNGQKAVLSQG